MSDGSTMKAIREAVSSYAASFDPDQISALVAQRLVEDAIATENMLATIKALAAKRVADTELWKRDGDLSPAHHLARKSGTTVTKAKESLETATRLSQLGALDAAARAGDVSCSQAGAIADAATKDPRAEARLLAVAKRGSLGELLDECARTKAAAEPHADARHKAIHRSRFLRRRRTVDGAGELTYRSTLEEVAEIFSVVQGHAQAVFEKARAEGRREPEEAYLADGLLATARAGSARAATARAATARAATAGAATARAATAPGSAWVSDDPLPPPVRPAKVVVRIDWAALVRGWPAGEEVCEIAGLGPVPVSVVQAMIASGDAFLAAVVTKGTDVVNVAHLGRRPSASQRSALDWMNPTCTAWGCNSAVRLEIDHRQDWAETRITLLSLLDGLCRHHHRLKTYKGWALVGGTGKRAMVAPDDARHLNHGRAGPSPPVCRGA